MRLSIRSTCALAALVVAAAASSAQASFPGANGRIAFNGSGTGGQALWTVLPDGTGAGVLVQATQPNPGGFHPAWSADGKQLAFTDQGGLWVVKDDGSSMRLVLAAGVVGTITEPTWSPTGTEIAFAALTAAPYGAPDIYKVPSGGGTPVKLTNTAGTAETAPAWSPSGTGIAFERDGDIFTMTPTGGSQVNLTNRSTSGPSFAEPDWHPNGTGLVVQSTSGLATIPATGGAPTSLGVVGADPVYSPDAASIAYVAFGAVPYGTSSIHVVSATGGTSTRVSPQGLEASQPNWQPVKKSKPKKTTSAAAFVESAAALAGRSLTRGGSAAVLKRRALAAVTMPAAGTFEASLVRNAKGGRRIVLARARIVSARGAERVLRLRATRAGRRVLRSQRRVRATLRVEYRMLGSASVGARQKVVLRRAG